MKIRCPVHQPVCFIGNCHRDESARSLRWRLIKREFPLHINKSSLCKAKSTFVPLLFLQPTSNHLGNPFCFNFKLQLEFNYSSSPCYSCPVAGLTWIIAINSNLPPYHPFATQKPEWSFSNIYQIMSLLCSKPSNGKKKKQNPATTKQNKPPVQSRQSSVLTLPPCSFVPATLPFLLCL